MRMNQSIIGKTFFAIIIVLTILLVSSVKKCSAQHDSKAFEQLLTREQLILLTTYENANEVDKLLTSLGWIPFITHDSKEYCWVLRKTYNIQFIYIKNKKMVYKVSSKAYMGELGFDCEEEIGKRDTFYVAKFKRKKRIRFYQTNLENL